MNLVREKKDVKRSRQLVSVDIDARCTAILGLEHTSDDVSATRIILIITHILKNLGMQLL